MSEWKKKIVACFDSAAGIREGDTIKLLTAAWLIQGTVVRDFSKDRGDNFKINAYIMDSIASAADDEQLMFEFVFLTDAKLINGKDSAVALDNIIVFTDEIIGVFA